MNDTALVIATILGPILAVQAQKFIERASDSRRRKMRIFVGLMATRAARVSPEHVQALNMIDIEFIGRKVLGSLRYQTKKEKTVSNEWSIYRDILYEDVVNTSESQQTDWLSRSQEQFIALLHAISIALGYDFDKVLLKRGIYTPRAHGEQEIAQLTIRDSLVKILSGKQPIPMEVTSFPVSEDALKMQSLVQEEFLALLSGQKPLKVTIDDKATGNEKAAA